MRYPGKVTHGEKLADVPDGAIVELDAIAHLIWRQQLLRWSFYRYSSGETPRLSKRSARVPTPASIMHMLRNGFRPDVHESTQMK